MSSLALPSRVGRITRYLPSADPASAARSLSIRIRESNAQNIVFDAILRTAEGCVTLAAEGIEMSHSVPLMRLAEQGPPVDMEREQQCLV